MVAGIQAGALFTWFGGVADGQEVMATASFVGAAVATGISFWHTHLLGRNPGVNFAYAQVLLDVALATVIVHITGGPLSTFTPLYILVIAEGALLLPLPGGVLIGVLASSLYIADIFWFHEAVVDAVLFQITLFTLVALATGFLGDRLRRAGIALGEVESELRQLRHDTGDILANVSSGILTVDGLGRLAYLNPAGERLLHLSSAEWLGVDVISSVDEIAPGMGRLIRRSIDDRVSVPRFKTRTRLGGREVVFGVSTAVLERDGEGPPWVTAVFQDITELERIASLNRRTERLQAVAELSASLAHEIKNPLASIRSSVEQLTQPKLGGEDRQVLERLVLTESDRLSRLLSEFLEFSAMRRGKGEPFDFAELVRHSVALARQRPECEQGVELRHSGLDEPLNLEGDPDLLHRAVFNLVLNALQFSSPSGVVTVTLDRSPDGLPAAVAEFPEVVRLSVSDTGPGIQSDDVERIFDPFYTTRPGGSGLGLAVVHRAVQAHEGAVLVEEAPAGGADFVVYLPGQRSADLPSPALEVPA